MQCLKCFLEVKKKKETKAKYKYKINTLRERESCLIVLLGYAWVDPKPRIPSPLMEEKSLDSAVIHARRTVVFAS